jgi:putative transposase
MVNTVRMTVSQPVLNWPHAPIHRFLEVGTYMVTAGTYRKQLLFDGADRLNYLSTALLTLAQEYGWQMHAWAIFANHYHFVAESEQPDTLKRFVQYLHSISAKFINRLDSAPGRKVWFQYWDSRITYHKSFLARLKYVHTNAVKHKIVSCPDAYPWCSAGWFAREAQTAFHSTVMNFPSDRVAVPDDYEVRSPAK